MGNEPITHTNSYLSGLGGPLLTPLARIRVGTKSRSLRFFCVAMLTMTSSTQPLGHHDSGLASTISGRRERTLANLASVDAAQNAGLASRYATMAENTRRAYKKPQEDWQVKSGFS